MRVEEKCVHPPGIWFAATVQVIVFGNLREMSAALLLQVIGVGGMFCLNIVDPSNAGQNWKYVTLRK